MKLWSLIVGSFVFISIGCKEKLDKAEKNLVSSSHVQMGTQWNIKIYALDTVRAQRAIDKSWNLLDALNAVLSNFEEESDVSNLARQSGDSSWVDISGYTADVLNKSRIVWSASQGSFDITIAPVMKLWRRSFKTQKKPEIDRVEAAHRLIGMEYLQVQGTQARLLKSGMSIDLGGIAKGYAVDLIVEYLSEQGYDQVLVEGGGDLSVGESPPNESGWLIGRESLDAHGDLVLQLDTLSNVAVATSGNKFQYIAVGEDRIQHHIDPYSGAAVHNVYQVLVQSDFCWKADAISTAISILGSNKIEMKSYTGYMITGNDPYEITYF